jgi:ATP-dependent helicase/nuclease subunit B
MVSEVSLWWEMFQQGIEMMPHLEQVTSKAGPCDGITNANSLHWQDLVSRGFSPTALGTYAQCPMRYWMTHVLKVQGVQDPMSKELPSRVWGQLVHQVLCGLYQDLSTHGWPQQIITPVHCADIVNSHVNSVFQEYAQRFGKGYWLLWDWMRTRLIRMMMLVIEYDRQEFLEQGWIPDAYEVEAAGMLHCDSEAPPELLKIRGRFDRVDRTSDHSRERIVDYKVSMRRSFHADELDLVTKALQGQQLQPPLYSFMTSMPVQHVDRLSTISLPSVDFRYLRPLQEEAVRSASFSGSIWDTPTGEQLKRTIKGWVEGIRSGQFFMLPGTYCRSCPYAMACRFQHHPSWVRAYGLPLAKTYRQIRKQKACHD